MNTSEHNPGIRGSIPGDFEQFDPGSNRLLLLCRSPLFSRCFALPSLLALLVLGLAVRRLPVGVGCYPVPPQREHCLAQPVVRLAEGRADLDGCLGVVERFWTQNGRSDHTNAKMR